MLISVFSFLAILIHNEKRVPGIFFPKIAKKEKPDINMEKHEKHNPDTQLFNKIYLFYLKIRIFIF
jgi:hypothetical protein